MEVEDPCRDAESMRVWATEVTKQDYRVTRCMDMVPATDFSLRWDGPRLEVLKKLFPYALGRDKGNGASIATDMESVRSGK